MAGESISGKNCKVTIGTDIILGIGNFTISGGAFAEEDDTAYGDKSVKVLRGLRSGSTVKFAGKLKSDDTTGQIAITDAYWEETNLTDLRFYIGADTWYAPNDSLLEGGGLPAGIEISHIKIMEEPSISNDVADLVKIEFSGKVEGAMRLFTTP